MMLLEQQQQQLVTRATRVLAVAHRVAKEACAMFRWQNTAKSLDLTDRVAASKISNCVTGKVDFLVVKE